MKYSYNINSTILNLTYQFSKSYERFEMLPRDNVWLRRLTEIQARVSSFAAVSIDKSLHMQVKNSLLPNGWEKIEEKLSEGQKYEYQSYYSALQNIAKSAKISGNYSLETIESIHSQAIGDRDSMKYKFRTTIREIDRLILENKVYKTIKQRVNTEPGDIMERLSALVNWLNSKAKTLNPLIAASITHVKIADIHPYPDGNGRLARLLDNRLLLNAGYNYYQIVSLEGYFLDTAERYFELIAKTIASGEYSEWIEYYLTGLLTASEESATLLKAISGGAINLQERKIVELTPKEIEALDMISSGQETNGAGIARQMGVTRQSVNQLLHRLREKGLLEKTGEAAGSMFRLVG
jgi:Fic family protein